VNITISHGCWSYSRDARLRDVLWIAPFILLSCGVC
jgi:hypothetical protein